MPFTFPDVAGRHVFVLGLGGGCDVITAYAASRLLSPGAARVMYGNTKTDSAGPVERLTPHVARVASPVPEPGHKPNGCGSAAIDHGVPRDAHGSPWIVLLGRDHDADALATEIASLGFDLIIGVDAGGDSIVTKRGRTRPGRDQRVLAVLFRTRVPVLHVVVAPGCDGESRTEDLCDALAARLNAGAYRVASRWPRSSPSCASRAVGLARPAPRASSSRLPTGGSTAPPPARLSCRAGVARRSPRRGLRTPSCSSRPLPSVRSHEALSPHPGTR
ncbi:Uncharacterized protein OS=Emiliania huxleyi CCMP1516 GN=EMIHUDRAFT_199930 PE=4 SV=1: DUF1152 [Gemmataceae bacterium]|nr:Uncharacterized protein OS=Emiliania huxleyi CCMP1516 GN=EMIHUDRAFT_199930 PE=4 SV=1: DUF1152 [Gemmataceae bacterium]VTU02831.1 Uncharacterized protein OS=Emiliania huxleyi CCMP1516 GN=EMIHUDRAFT_199930 PE=4 SV=1: DUF1152 [Gemmataceae bacterium]